MLRSLYTAGTGMIAQQHNLDVISNNLANVNTTGFKQQRAEFQDLMYDTMRTASAGDTAGSPENMQVGFGVKLGATSSNFKPGSLQNTGNPLNLAISGDGFFKVTRPDGSPAYTRDGSFQVDGRGRVVTIDGFPLDPEVTVPAGSTAITIGEEGDVNAIPPGETSSKVFGTVNVTSVANPAGMARIGGNLFVATEAAGDMQDGKPGTNGTGMLQSGFLEGSNVEVVEEMTRMITAQRAYEINSKAIQTADDMLSIVNQLKR